MLMPFFIFRLQKVVCGELHSVAATTDNELMMWGLRHKPPASPPSPDTYRNEEDGGGVASGGGEREGGDVPPPPSRGGGQLEVPDSTRNFFFAANGSSIQLRQSSTASVAGSAKEINGEAAAGRL